MQKKHSVEAVLAAFVLLAGCSQHPTVGDKEKWESCRSVYTTVVHYSGENESTEKYLEIAQRSAELFPLLEENTGAFVMDAYNYQSIDDNGTPLYTQNKESYPMEIAPNGHSIRVSRNYFLYNPIETVDGSNLIEQILYDDTTLNVLVPEKYRDMEEEILESYHANFFFEKIVAEDDYNKLAGIDKSVDISPEELSIHIIYVKDGQQYFTYRKDCAVQTDNWITDPVVQIYTSNIHCNYAHSFLSQWVYFESDGGSEKKAYADILPYVQQCGAEGSIQKVKAIYRP